MGKSQRGNRELKKPKQVKAKPVAVPSFSRSITAQLMAKNNTAVKEKKDKEPVADINTELMRQALKNLLDERDSYQGSGH